MSRSTTLESLLNLNAPLSEIQAALSAFPWDSDEELVTLESRHIAAVLARYVDGGLTDKEVEAWANSLELREDIGVRASMVRQCLHELANPELEQPLTKIRAQWWLTKL
jgi:hypothetical protein